MDQNLLNMLTTTEAHVSREKAVKSTMAIALGFLFAGVLMACKTESVPQVTQSKVEPAADPGRNEPAGTESESAAAPMGGEWRLVAIDRRELSSGGTPTVVFSKEGECWGNTGINEFRTTFTLEGLKYGRLKVSNAAVTRKAGPPEAMALERLFLERLESARSFEIKGDLLYLNSGENQNLTLERVYQ